MHLAAVALNSLFIHQFIDILNFMSYGVFRFCFIKIIYKFLEFWNQLFLFGVESIYSEFSLHAGF